MNKQKNRNRTNRKSLWHFVLAAVIFCVAVSLLVDLIAWVIHLMGGISFSVPSAATIGIIGGADGPTSVFVAASTGSWWGPVCKLLFLGLGFYGWRCLNRRE